MPIFALIARKLPVNFYPLDARRVPSSKKNPTENEGVKSKPTGQG